MGTQQEQIMGLEGVFMGLIMGDEISYHSSACKKKKNCKILWVPIMPGTQMIWVRDFFFWTFQNFLLGSFCWEDACH